MFVLKNKEHSKYPLIDYLNLPTINDISFDSIYLKYPKDLSWEEKSNYYRKMQSINDNFTISPTPIFSDYYKYST